MKDIIPDFAWYAAESRRLGLQSPRCPFASVHACPRYYSSLSLLGGAGSTAISKELDEQLERKWKVHLLWPATGEQASGIFSGNHGPSSYLRFCPEVSYDAFRLFASDLSRHYDETDRDIAAEQLNRDGATWDDPRRIWCSIRPQHYAECPLYSPLSHPPKAPSGGADGAKVLTSKSVIPIIVAIIGLVGAVIAALISAHTEKSTTGSPPESKSSLPSTSTSAPSPIEQHTIPVLNGPSLIKPERKAVPSLDSTARG